MCAPQSFGFGIRAGDLKHTLSDSLSAGEVYRYIPTIRIGDSQPTCHPWRPHEADSFETQSFFTESVDYVSKPLPRHHLYQRVGNEICSTHPKLYVKNALTLNGRVIVGLTCSGPHWRTGHWQVDAGRLAWVTKAFCRYVSAWLFDNFRSATHVNIKCRGIPSFSAQCIPAKLGGFAIMASAMNGLVEMSPSMPVPLSRLVRLLESPKARGPSPSPISIHDRQHPFKIS